MKRFLISMLLIWLVLPVAVRADGPDDQYVTIYAEIQVADTLAEKGQLADAMTKYIEAQSALKRLKASNPEWSPRVVKFRLSYLAGKIEQLSSQPVRPAAPAVRANPAPAPAEPVSPAVPPAPVVPVPSEAEVQVKNLQDQVGHLEADKALLEAKLKEALSAQPAAVDPHEFAKIQNQNQELLKEIELLKAVHAEPRTNAAPAPVSNAALTEAQQALAQSVRKVAQLTDANASLTTERDALVTRLKTSATPGSATAALAEENEILKRQLTELKNKAEPAPATASAPMLDSVTADRINQLEAQRDELQKNLNAALKDASGRKKGKEIAARLDEMTRQVASLRARIDSYEARQIPYTPEELALLTKPDASLAATVHNPGKKSVRTLPANGAILLSEAKRFVAAHQLENAEGKYLEVLKLDEKNVSTLDDLASIQIALNHTEAAEKNLTASLAVDPNNDYTYLVLGRLKFQQGKLDESLNALGRAAQINSQDAEIQSFLGVVLSEKGLRGPAETALRKAIQIDPGYADAHANLAFVYITQQPPLTELARWHYLKALASGHPHDPRLEKLIDPANPGSFPP